MFSFHPYGLLISLGILAGLLVAWWRKKLYGISKNDLENLFLLIVPLGIIGARIYHVWDKWNYYSENPLQIFVVWNGGIGIYGAVAGGLLGIWIFTKVYGIRYTAYGNKDKTVNRKPFTVYQLLDFLMPSLALGQAIARWGNFFNHEVFGPPTNLPWGWFIPVNLRPEMWKSFSFFQPTFAYESLWALIGFFLLLILEFNPMGPVSRFLGRRFSAASKPPSAVDSSKTYQVQRLSPIISTGLLTGFYCVWYGVGRFFLEFWRFDTAQIWGIKTAQIISLVLVVYGVLQMYIITHDRNILCTEKKKLVMEK